MKKMYGVLLYDEAYDQIGPALEPYTSKGKIGKYIYCQTAVQVGAFLSMTFAPDMHKGDQLEMQVSLPLSFVKFIVAAEDLPAGFRPG